MSEILYLNANCSTTRLLIQEKPEIIHNPKDTFEMILFLPEKEGRKDEGGLRTKGYFKKSYQKNPLITIITVVYNGEKHLEETIQSVINQTYDNVEYIIIDGGSTDGTVDIIKKYENQIDYWVSERDKGIYDAMNKGIQVATGEWINFMNAGDKIYKNNTVENMIQLHPKADVYYGDTQLVNHNGDLIKLVQAPSKLSWQSFLHGMVVSHQSIAIKKSLLNLYNLEYKYVSDHDWIVNALQKANKIVYTNMPMSKYLLDGFSQQNFEGCWQEKFKIVKKYHGSSGLLLNYYYYGIAKIKNIIKSKLRKG